MNTRNMEGYSRILRPYLLIALIGILAFAPISFMLQSVKNDIVAIEYPINYFLSQCIRQGELPYWFNTWGMGFPLTSNLTWGIFSTPQLIFCSLFDYNINTLHIEFVFFVVLSGWSMFHLLRKYMTLPADLALLFSVCYMLSGFTVGSTQWLLYVTAAAFVPLVISSTLKLLRTPSTGSAFQFAAVYTMMFTSVYMAFNIITSYALIIFLVIHFLGRSGTEEKKRQGKFLLAAAGLTALMCGPALYYTLELLQHIHRGGGIANENFFNSNYVPPASLSSLLLPFSSVRMSFANTEGTMFHMYAGLLSIVLLPFAISFGIRSKNRAVIFLLVTAFVFLLLSFGGITPVRNAFNLLPGFSYFRNPGIFRFYFLLTLLLAIAVALKGKELTEVMDFRSGGFGKIAGPTMLALGLFYIIVSLANIHSAGSFRVSLDFFVKEISLSQTLLVSAVVQILLLTCIFLCIRSRSWNAAKFLFIGDMVVNTLICTPFFSVSSYSPAEVNRLLQSTTGFPRQAVTVGQANTVLPDTKGNRWVNVNVYAKQVSVNESYRGPLTLRVFEGANDSGVTKKLKDKPLIYTDHPGTGTVVITEQKPATVKAELVLSAPATVTLLQNKYPGWKAYYNNKELDLLVNDSPGISVSLPEGEGTLEFRYRRPFAWVSALLLHFLIIGFLTWRLLALLKRLKKKG